MPWRGSVALLVALLSAAAPPPEPAAEPPRHPPLRDKDDHCGMYPPDIYDDLYAAVGDCWLRMAGERPLWKGLARRGYRQQIRFAFNDGHSRYTKVIDFVEFASGKGLVELKTLVPTGRHGGIEIEDDRRAAVSAADVRRLNALAAEAGVWQFRNGSWNDEEIYMHCETLDMEKVDAAGYRFSNVLITCIRPKRLMPFVDFLSALAGLKPSGLLY